MLQVRVAVYRYRVFGPKMYFNKCHFGEKMTRGTAENPNNNKVKMS